MTKNDKEKMTAVRWLAIACGIALFVVDYILDLSAKPIPVWAYAAIAAVATGVDAPAMRNVLLAFLRNASGGAK